MTRPPCAKTRLALAVLVVAPALLAVARPAWALCPNCLGQHAALTPTMRIVGVFLLVPAAVFFVVARLVRRLGRSGPQSL